MTTLVAIALSAYSLQDSPGDLITVDESFRRWKSDYCDALPVYFLKPFTFTFTVPSNGFSSSYSSYCGFSISLAAYRLVIQCVTFVLVVALFRKTFLSSFARSILFTGFICNFICFVLDSNAAFVGQEACRSLFVDTALGLQLSLDGISINCYNDVPIVMFLFDLWLAFQYYLVFECWAMCSNLYGHSSSSNSGKYVSSSLHSGSTTKGMTVMQQLQLEQGENAVENPLHGNEPSTNRHVDKFGIVAFDDFNHRDEEDENNDENGFHDKFSNHMPSMTMKSNAFRGPSNASATGLSRQNKPRPDSFYDQESLQVDAPQYGPRSSNRSHTSSKTGSVPSSNPPSNKNPPPSSNSSKSICFLF